MVCRALFLVVLLLSFKESIGYSFDVTPLRVGDAVNTSQARILEDRYRRRAEQPFVSPKLSEMPKKSEIEYGFRLLSQTSSLLGPNAPDTKLRISKNNLNCTHCHQAGESGLPGTKPYSIPWTNVLNDYPKLDVKTMKVISLEDRIIGMLGKASAPEIRKSREVRAIISYMTWLSSKSQPNMRMAGTGLLDLSYPDRPSDPKRGRELYQEKCISCHGAEGKGSPQADFKKGGGYVFPPIAGNDTYDDGGHMYLVPLFARFILVNMPLGATAEKPILTVDQALDISAYVNSELNRTHSVDRKKFYPDPEFREKGFAVPESFDRGPASFQKAKFGPFK